MIQIQVKYRTVENYPVHLVDGEWRCWHVIDPSEVDVVPPCCSGFSRIIECGCGGLYSVYCPDCQNDDMREEDIENIIEGRYNG